MTAPTTPAPAGPSTTREATPDAASPPAAGPDGGASSGRDATRERVALLVGAAIVLVVAAGSIGGRSLWHDEAYTLAAINDPWLSLSSTHGTMGLYYVLMWAWGQVSVAAWWLRVPSVASALGTLVVTRSIARRIGGTPLVTVAVPLLALLPVFEMKATDARSYALETLLVSLCWWTSLRATDAASRGTDLRWWLLLVPLAAAGVLSHGLFVVHLVPVALVGLAGPRPRRALLGLAPAVAVAAAIAWVLRSAGASNVGVTFAGGTAEWVSITIGEYLPGPPIIQALLVVALLAGCATSVHLIARSSTPEERAGWVVPVAWTLGPCVALTLVSAAFPLNHPRYLAPITPGIALALAIAVRHAARALPSTSLSPQVRTRLAAAALPVVVVLLAVSLATASDPTNQDWRAAAGMVEADARPGDAILFANVSNGEPEQHRPPFEAAWADAEPEVELAVVSSGRPLGSSRSIRRYEADPRSPGAMAAAAEGRARIWVVDGGTGASVGRDAILAHPGFADLERIGEWTFPHRIEISLYERVEG